MRGQRGLHRILEMVTHTCNFLGREGAGVPCVRPPVGRLGPSHQVEGKFVQHKTREQHEGPVLTGLSGRDLRQQLKKSFRPIIFVGGR